jgi:PEP-CTERM motif
MTRHLILAATVSTLCLSAPAVDSISIVNPSFQANLPGGVGYGPVNGWFGGSGVNNGGMPFADNGFIPDQDQVAFLQGPASISQTLSGFAVGDLYWIQGFVNSRNCCGDIPIASVSMAGSPLLTNQPVPPVGGANPYYFVNIPWTATVASGDLAISSAPFGGGDATLLLDGISVIRRTSADVVIANPSFEASGNSFGFPGYINPPFSIAGWSRSSTANLIINGSNGSGNPFSDNGLIPDGGNVLGLQQAETLSQTLNGLVAGQTYRFELDYNSRQGVDPNALFTINGLTAFSGAVDQVGGANPYHHLSFEFIATSTTTTITLANTLPQPTDSTLLVDNVRVQLVPEPGSVALLGLGAVVLARRRRKA